MQDIHFAEHFPHEQGFSEHYRQHILPQLEELEAARLSARTHFFIAVVVSAVIAVPLIYAMITSGFVARTDKGAEAVFAIAIAATLWPSFVYGHYRKRAKGNLLPLILAFRNDLGYAPEGLEEEFIQGCELLPSYHRFHSEDRIHGTIGDVFVELAEVHLKRKSKRSSYTVYRGVVARLTLPKALQGRTVVLRDQGGILNWMRRCFRGLSRDATERVALEDPRFETRFEVYGTDQIESRYLLTTAFMERLLALSALMHHWGKPGLAERLETLSMEELLEESGSLQAIFEGSMMTLSIPCKRDLFEPGTLFRSAYDLEEIRNVLYQIQLIYRLVEVLKLNQRIGL